MTKSEADWVAMQRGPRKWSTGEAERMLAAWRGSGESLSVFARRHGLNSERIRYWRDRAAEPEEPKAVLLPVVVRSRPERVSHTAARLAITTASERLEIFDTAELDPNWLGKLVRALDGEVRS
jgi:transposase-like protein